MTNIIAIGGGEIGRPGFPVETTLIDKEIVRLAKKQNPRLLFVPTASSDNQLYIDTVIEHFGKRLGCNVDVLRLFGDVTNDEITRKIHDADIIYVGGGNTLKMMNRWRKFGVDKLLRTASKDTVLAGLSAGAICWFNNGLSDSRSFKAAAEDWNYIRVTGLKLYPLLLCPHYSNEPSRQQALDTIMRRTSGIAVALDNCVALQITDETFRIIRANNTGKAYKIFWKNNVFHKEEIKPSDQFEPLQKLLA